MSWPMARIGQFTHVVTKGTTPTKEQGFADSGINYIKAEALNGDSSLDLSGCFFISEDVHQALKRSILEDGDVLLTIAGANIGKCGIVEDRHLPANTNQAVGIMRVDRQQINPRFLYYWFKQPRTFRYIQGLNAQAAQPNINLSMLKNIEVPVPPISEQKQIADVISTYDDLIENNRRRIQLLEQSARLLYKEWFIRLRFPGHEHVKIKDGVPEGWESVALSELADFINGFAFKPIHLGDEGLPVVKIPELRQGVTNKTPRNPGDMIPEKYHLEDGDLLFSWSGTLAVNVWASGPALLNQHLFNVVPYGNISRAFLMCALREALVAFANQTVGATMKHIRRSALDNVFVLMPDDAILSIAEEALNNIYQQIITLHKQNHKLADARDLLLPRLMNGEVTV